MIAQTTHAANFDIHNSYGHTIDKVSVWLVRLSIDEPVRPCRHLV